MVCQLLRKTVWYIEITLIDSYWENGYELCNYTKCSSPSWHSLAILNLLSWFPYPGSSSHTLTKQRNPPFRGRNHEQVGKNLIYHFQIIRVLWSFSDQQMWKKLKQLLRICTLYIDFSDFSANALYTVLIVAGIFLKRSLRSECRWNVRKTAILAFDFVYNIIIADMLA